ncbi:exosome component 10-like isoform X2 [Anthonomus grandis grandis]|uniref:exosome component 10-like isoform X2 n=1 Tax=Anthonomus grandis grandis TaxID=2921223 RepID=UPI00216693B7|nr:exosome component 10-like isoform X2 [Anthonomus grandis grandis]
MEKEKDQENLAEAENPAMPPSQETSDIIPGYKSIDDFTKDGFKILMEGIKHANALPSGNDLNFYRTFESFNNINKSQSDQILANISNLLKKTEVGGNIYNQTVDKKTEILIDANDIILERIANDIDEMNGIKKFYNEPVVLHTVSAQVPANINGSWNRSNVKFSMSDNILTKDTSNKTNATTIRLLAGENILRPQKFFKDKINNNNDYPWEPRIRDKPNSLKPLAIFLEETENGKEFSHPYEFELDRFTPAENLLKKTEITSPKPIKDTPLIEINTPEQLPELLEDLQKYQFIAVDVEHHSYRSFMGITCLVQISTPEKDYLIDALALRNDLWVLNEVFTKPSITKIFHGADSDIPWLQRDLSLYVVNMFDTHQAAKQLGYSGLSLAYLMRRFCSFTPNKQFQLADWRIRPLPTELKNYAREDTHYLIYIYQNMRNELIDKGNGKSNLLKAVIGQSTALCLKRYFKPIWNEQSHMEFYRRCHRNFDNRQLFALKEIYKWRDRLARSEDESTGYVLPNNMLLEIAGRLPKEMQGILACCSPVPPLLRANLLEIHKIILKALEQPFEEPILKEPTRARGSAKKMTKINIDSPLHCPHDLTKSDEFRDDLPTLLKSPEKQDIESILFAKHQWEHTKSICSVFNSAINEVIEETNSIEKLRKFKENFKFLGPFERYTLVKPFIESRERKLAEERKKLEEEKREETKRDKDVTDSGTQEERTDEERIESIREHFLSLARQALPTEATTHSPKKMSLLEMGGSKKRKRDESPMDPLECAELEHNVQTPLPNFKIKLHTNVDSAVERNSTKRKSCEADPGPSKVSDNCRTDGGSKKKLSPKKKGKNGKQQNSMNQDSITQDPTNDKPKAPNKTKKNKNKRWKNNNKNKKPPAKEEHNQSEEFNAYDYATVDFKQFQGGAGRGEQKKQFNSKFRGKNRNRGGRGRGQKAKAMSFKQATK